MQPPPPPPPPVTRLEIVEVAPYMEEVHTQGPSDEELLRVARDKSVSRDEFDAFLARYDYSVTVGFYVGAGVAVTYPDLLRKHNELASVENWLRQNYPPFLQTQLEQTPHQRDVVVRYRAACAKLCGMLLRAAHIQVPFPERLVAYEKTYQL